MTTAAKSRRNPKVRVLARWVAVGCDQMTTRPYATADQAMAAIFKHEDQRGHTECSDPELRGYRAYCEVCKRTVTDLPVETFDEALSIARLHESTGDHQRRHARGRREHHLIDQALGVADP